MVKVLKRVSEVDGDIPAADGNESTAVFRVLVVKVPKPTEETKLL
jgi:hypothetical protein